MLAALFDSYKAVYKLRGITTFPHLVACSYHEHVQLYNYIGF